jgi:threonine/homoserine/homoserine lactone efflux protein
LLIEALGWVFVFLMGFLEAVPVGATQLEIARRSLRGYLSSALMVVVGSVLSDAMYGVLAFWGVAPLLGNKWVVAAFWTVGAILSAVLGVWSLREGRTGRSPSERSIQLLQKHHLSFLTGFSLAITNPFMIAYWLIGAHMFESLGFVPSEHLSSTVPFLVFGLLGIASYLTLLAAMVYKAKRFLTEAAIRRMTVGFGIVLLVLASYFGIRAISYFNAPEQHQFLLGVSPWRNRGTCNDGSA